MPELIGFPSLVKSTDFLIKSLSFSPMVSGFGTGLVKPYESEINLGRKYIPRGLTKPKQLTKIEMSEGKKESRHLVPGADWK